MAEFVERFYYAKKWFALFPGVVRPVAGGFLAEHYAARAARRGPARAVLDAVVGLGFRAWIPLRARAVQRRFGLDAAWRRRAVGIAQARFADPNDIALFRIEHAEELDGYIRRFEDAGLNKLVNPAGWRDDCALTDKVRFYRRCAAAGLRHPDVVAVIRDGTIDVVADLADRAPMPLLLKPARGEGGRGVRFVDAPPAAWEDPALFARWIGTHRQAMTGLWLVQRREATHPDITDIAMGALTTARITTILNEEASPEAVSAVLRLASDPAAQVDNMKAGGLLAPIDTESGRLGIACKGYGGGDHTHHPATGAAIAGRAVPDWAAAKALAIAAHDRAFSGYAMIGWDIGITARGPVLIEGNGKPGVLMPQRAARRGLGTTRYGALLAHQLRLADQRLRFVVEST